LFCEAYDEFLGDLGAILLTCGDDLDQVFSGLDVVVDVDFVEGVVVCGVNAYSAFSYNASTSRAWDSVLLLDEFAL
jgi:hypothetical protein